MPKVTPAARFKHATIQGTSHMVGVVMNSRILTVVCLGALIAGAAHAGDATSTKPQYGSWGFDQAGADMSVRPGDNFFRYANGTWLDRTPIPADKPAVSLRLAMTDLTEQRLHAIMESAATHATDQPATLQDKVGAFYRSFMDDARIEALGAKPIAPQLDAVRQAATRDALAALMGRTNVDFEGSLFNVGIDVDLKDPKRYAVYIGQGGLGLPDRDYYLKLEFAKQKAAYQAYVTTLFGYRVWNNLMKKYPSAMVAPLSLMVPISGVGTSWLMFDESIGAHKLASIVLILLGIALFINAALITNWLRARAARQADEPLS